MVRTVDGGVKCWVPTKQVMGILKWKSLQSCLTLQLHEIYSPWNSLGQNAGVGSLSLLQRIFPTQESNPEINRGLLHCRWILYQLSYESNLSLTGSVFPPPKEGINCAANGKWQKKVVTFLWQAPFHFMNVYHKIQKGIWQSITHSPVGKKGQE